MNRTGSGPARVLALVALCCLVAPERSLAFDARECTRKGAAGVAVRMNILKDRLEVRRREQRALAPLVREMRRLEEEHCAVKARCETHETADHKGLAYGEVFLKCLEK